MSCLLEAINILYRLPSGKRLYGFPAEFKGQQWNRFDVRWKGTSSQQRIGRVSKRPYVWLRNRAVAAARGIARKLSPRGVSRSPA